MRTSSRQNQVRVLLSIRRGTDPHTTIRSRLLSELPLYGEARLSTASPRVRASVPLALPADPPPAVGATLQLPVCALLGIWEGIRASRCEGYQGTAWGSCWRRSFVGEMEGDGYPGRVK